MRPGEPRIFSQRNSQTKSRIEGLQEMATFVTESMLTAWPQRNARLMQVVVLG